jgi:hypothetical protein
MSTLKIAVNASRLIQNIGSVFSGNHKVLSELLQNARRAGATKIVVKEVDATTLVISDNGSGIKDMQKLLTLAESGWDEATQELEHPYGMGFFSALFSAKEVVVKSCGKQITVHADGNLLDQKIDLEEGGVFQGTVVELRGHTIPNLENAIYGICRGFSVEVTYQKAGLDEVLTIPMPDQLDSDVFVDFACGQIKLSMDNVGWIAYLQGFKVASSGPSYNDHSWSTIHLDSASFKARMPDRDQLINKDVEHKRINQAVKQMQRQKLEAIKAANPTDVFAHRTLIVEQGFLDIFNDIPVLPCNYFEVISGTPEKYQDSFQGTQTSSYKAKGDVLFLSKDDVQAGFYLACQPSEDNESNPYAMALQMAVHQKSIPFLARPLDKNHWFYSLCKEAPDMDDLDQNQSFITVEYTANKTGQWWGTTISLVDHYTIKIPSWGLEVVVDNDPLAIGCDECGVDCAQSGFIIPSKNYGADVLKQVQTWWLNDYDADERGREDDIASLDGVLAVLYGNNAADVLQNLLCNCDRAILNALANQQFTVSVSENGAVAVTV